MKTGTKIVIDLLCGAAAAALALLQGAVTFSGYLRFGAFAGIFAAIVLLPLMTLLLMQLDWKHRQIRSLSAILGYPFIMMLGGKIDFMGFIFSLFNSQNGYENDSPNRVLFCLLLAWCLTVIAALLARFFSARKES